MGVGNVLAVSRASGKRLEGHAELLPITPQRLGAMWRQNKGLQVQPGVNARQSPAPGRRKGPPSRRQQPCRAALADSALRHMNEPHPSQSCRKHFRVLDLDPRLEGAAPTDFFELLGIGLGATREDIRTAYRSIQAGTEPFPQWLLRNLFIGWASGPGDLAPLSFGGLTEICFPPQREVHPDVIGPLANEMAVLLNQAYAALTNDATREARSPLSARLTSSSKSEAASPARPCCSHYPLRLSDPSGRVSRSLRFPSCKTFPQPRLDAW